MCAIAGLLGAGSAPVAEAMIAAQAHRGPDGTRLEAIAGAVLAHARLSIIDLDGGWQPLHAEGCAVVGNGEIYNYLELTAEFDLPVTTGSDFEPLLRLFAREGPAAFDRLRGMYALCLVGADGTAWLARDPFGIKPLYLLEHDGGLAFASETRAFVAAGLLTPELKPEAAADLLALNYTLEAPFAAARRLAPGEIIEVRAGKVVSTRRRSPIAPPQSGRGTGEEKALLARLDAILEDSVTVHQRADVPYGLFLSGGIDSAVIATLMARLNTRPVTAFTCGFDVPGATDERAKAERVARALNLDWRETTFGEADFWAIAPKVAAALDDPTADYATLPTFKLAEAAKADLTVVLTGEGGDELFAGYGRYRRALRPAWLGGRPAAPRADDPSALARWRTRAAPPPGLTRLQQAQWADIATWLPDDLLLKLDRCLMAHGLEGRTPFLDREVAAFAFHLPDHLKVRGGYGKWLLRRWLADACPAADPWAKKQGFTVPVESWITPRADHIAARLNQVEAIRALPAGTQSFTGERRWPLLFFGLWALIHLQGATPEEALQTLAGTI